MKDIIDKQLEEEYGDPKKIIREELEDIQEFNLDSFPKDVKHNWVRRGCIISCEGADHPNHRHFIKEK